MVGDPGTINIFTVYSIRTPLYVRILVLNLILKYLRTFKEHTRLRSLELVLLTDEEATGYTK